MSKSDLKKIDTVKEYTRFLESNGYTARSNGGSHIVFSAKGKQSISLPAHKGKIAPGTKRNMDKLVLGDSYYAK